MQQGWEKGVDANIINAIDIVMNTLYRESKVNGRLNTEYFNHCTEIIKKRACNYIDLKLHALENI